MKQLAIIGPTASGKTSLSIAIAKALDGYILSLDSLSIYKEINIVSAKPSIIERDGIPHFGIDLLLPSKNFDVTTYFKLYQETSALAKKEKKPLIIVGGTSFYLKMLLDGISQLPKISSDTHTRVQEQMSSLENAYSLLCNVDPDIVQSIKPNDQYRIEKMLSIYFETGKTPTSYFTSHPPQSVIKDSLDIYEIDVERGFLRERIAQRTEQMIHDGLIDEVATLEKKYGRGPNCMKAIGIKETLAYLDGKYTLREMGEKITINTGRLAKRQETFNRSQFGDKFLGNAHEILDKILGFSEVG